MALIACQECGQQISVEAASCPSCGKPNRGPQRAAENSKQKVGCAVMVFSLLVGAVSPAAGIAVFLVGLLVMLINTRFS